MGSVFTTTTLSTLPGPLVKIADASSATDKMICSALTLQTDEKLQWILLVKCSHGVSLSIRCYNPATNLPSSINKYVKRNDHYCSNKAVASINGLRDFEATSLPRKCPRPANDVSIPEKSVSRWRSHLHTLPNTITLPFPSKEYMRATRKKYRSTTIANNRAWYSLTLHKILKSFIHHNCILVHRVIYCHMLSD